MAKEKRKRKVNLTGVIIPLACGAVIGIMIAFGIPDDLSFMDYVIQLLVGIALILAAFYIQLIIHEGGHLLAGLMTGYHFSSFRIGSLMLLKNHEGYSFKKFSLAGTGGQCLMIPPDRKPDGTYPYKIYHIGGILLNIITAVMFFAAYLFILPENIIGDFSLYLAVTGVICALINGIPMHTSGITTDGYNALHIGNEPFALDAMWLQLKINGAQTEGRRLKDLPEEWFTIPEEASKRNEIITTIACFSENRAMDGHDFDKAKEWIDKLVFGKEYTILGIYKNLLIFDKVTIELMEKGVNADTSLLNTKEMKAFRRAMSKFPGVIRTEYAISLLKDKNTEAATKYKNLFNKVALKYPTKSDIEFETEMLECIDKCAADSNIHEKVSENTYVK